MVYGKDQFFNKHQDTEKLEGMVTTLVMILPSPHIGGDLIVEHNKKQCIFSSENIDCNMIKYTAFYADCHHEIKKTTQGSRIALTYNLVLTSKNIAGKKNENPHLEKAIGEYFNSKENLKPLPLVYFLDHSYTEHSLGWNILKGLDRVNASSFYITAKKIGVHSSSCPDRNLSFVGDNRI